MKLKFYVIRAVVIVSFLLGGITLQAQGIYSTNKNSQTTGSTIPSNPNGDSGGGLYKGPGGNDGGPAGGGDSTPDPIGEGIMILSLLSAGYAFVKRNIRNRHED